MDDAYIKLQGLSHFGIDCRDLAAILPFYRDTLRLRIVHQEWNGRRVWLRAENGQLLCITEAQELTPMLTRRPERIATHQHHAHAALTVRRDEYLQAIENAQAHGIPGQYAARGPRQGQAPEPFDPWYFFDPEGYGLHFDCQKNPDGPGGELRIQEFDHYTYEVSDITAVERFYADVLDLPLHVRLGVDGRGPRHTFYWLGAHSIGFFQEDELKGARDPHRVWDSPQFWAFRVAPEDFDPARRKLDQLETEVSGPMEHPSDWPIARSIRFSDPDGFSLVLAVWREGMRNP
jgi:catechol 2,3-dioxygenase-like lactoylglutathione lyase family enzyme